MTIELTLLSRVAYRGQEISGPRLRGLVALLVADLRTGASIPRLVDGLWPDAQPENPTKALQVLVFRVRSQLGSDVLVSTPTGYRIELADDQVDAAAVVRAADAASRALRAGDDSGALAEAEGGLRLWADTPPDPADAGAGLDDPVTALRVARAATYDDLGRTRALALCRLGRAAEALGPLREVLAGRPRDEEALLALLRAEAATAGPAAALETYDGYRRSLRDELGADPGPALRAEYQQLLRADPPAERHGLVEEPNPLLGRDADLAAVAGLLRTSRVTSIVGPGGLGKTRLANAVARQAPQRVVHVVGLAGVGSDAGVVSEVASALGVAESPTTVIARGSVLPDTLTGIAGALGPGPALLVLDNCEHVRAGVADLVRALVSAKRELTVLATSRAPLGLSSESVYLLPELSLATTVELFEQRSRAARPDVELPADLVTDLCRHLDGLPLAVELAAARVRVMSVAAIARGLDDRFALLRGGPRDAPERHRTLRAVVEWSWDLLDDADRDALRALSIFPSGFTAEAAGFVVGRDGANDAEDVLSTLEHLVDHSLLKVIETPFGIRFRMLETVREFTADQREAAGRSDAAVDGLLAWVRGVGRTADAQLLGPSPMAPARLIQADQENYIAALRFALARRDGASVASVTAVLAALWAFESNFTRLLVLVDQTAPMLQRYRPEPEYVEVTRTALAISTMAKFMLTGGRASRSLATLRRLPPAPPDTAVRAISVVLSASPTLLLDEAAELRRMCASEQPLLAAMANGFASYAAEAAGDPAGSGAAAQGMLAALRDQNTPWLEALAHSRIAELSLQVEQGAKAAHHLEAAMSIVDSMGNWPDVLKIRWALVLATLQQGDVDAAERWLALTSLGDVEHAAGVVTFDIAVRAEIALARGDVESGLLGWRQTVRRIEDEVREAGYDSMLAGLQGWSLEARAVAVIAHARYGRLDLVTDLVADLPGQLSAQLADGMGLPLISGSLILALAFVDIEVGRAEADEKLSRRGVRLVALAERFEFMREFQPTMSSRAARAAAENADRPAYDEAVSSYAGLDRDALRVAGLAALAERTAERSTG